MSTTLLEKLNSLKSNAEAAPVVPAPGVTLYRVGTVKDVPGHRPRLRNLGGLMPTEPPAKWLIEFQDGAFDIQRNTRAFAYGLASVDVAIAAIKRSRKYQARDKITAYDEFGNRVLVR